MNKIFKVIWNRTTQSLVVLLNLKVTTLQFSVYLGLREVQMRQQLVNMLKLMLALPFPQVDSLKQKAHSVLLQGLMPVQQMIMMLHQGGAATGSRNALTSIKINGTEVGNNGKTSGGAVLAVGNSTAARQVQYVSAGLISSNSTDAINGSQLYQVISVLNATASTASAALSTASAALSAASSSASAAASSASSAASAADSSATAASSSASAAASSSASAAKEESKRVVKSTDENGKVNNVESEVDGNNATAVGSGAKAKGDNSSSFGTNANANGKNATAIGQGASASANNATAIGQGAQAIANNSVALGQGSVANEANTVSVGSVGNERRITNVADPVHGTDAANKQYVDSKLGSVHSDLRKTEKKLRGGIAGATAIANIPQATKAGGSMLGLGVGNYKRQSAVAVGYSKVTDNNKVIFKVSGAATTRGEYNIDAGVGYQW